MTSPEPAPDPIAEAVDLLESTGHLILAGEDRLFLIELLSGVACLCDALRKGFNFAEDEARTHMLDGTLSGIGLAMVDLGEAKPGDPLRDVVIRVQRRLAAHLQNAKKEGES